MIYELNGQSYTSSQIVEMKKSGVAIPDETYNNAQAELAQQVQTTSSDATNVSYAVEDFSGEVNEAKQLHEQLKSEGASLETMVKTFTEKSNQTAQDLNAVLNELNNNISYISQNQELSQKLASTANDEQAVVRQLIDETQKKVENKQKELNQLSEKIEDGTATEEEQDKAKSLNKEIADIMNQNSSTISQKQAVADDATSQSNTINAGLSDVAQKVGKGLTQANNGIEIAKETQELGKKIYDKGKKIQKIGMAIAGLLGGLGGFVAGAAVANSVNNENAEIYIKEHTTTTIYEDRKGNKTTVISTPNEEEVNDAIHATRTQIIGDVSGSVAGIGAGLAVGSMFGSEKIELGQNAMDSASQLKAKANDTKNVANKVAQQNNLAINKHSSTERTVNNLQTTITKEEATEEAKKKETGKASEKIDNYETKQTEDNNNDKLKNKKKDEK